MEEHQTPSALNALDPKSALIMGLVGGVLTLCTIGFLIFLGLLLGGKLELASSGGGTYALNDQYAAAAGTGVGNELPSTPPANIPKSDRPKVELFVMADCPYGLQMEKAYIPAWDLLKKKADIDVKFVSYAMHGKKEVDENTRQYCIQKEQDGKY